MNTLQVLALIVVLGVLLGLFKGLESPVSLTALVIAVIFVNETIIKKEGFATEEDKYKF
jgi:hypothetical protein